MRPRVPPRGPIPFCRPDVGEAEIEAVTRVLRSGWITTGPETLAFESELAAYLGAGAVCALASATAGMELVLRWYGVGPGDEVITTPYTYAATANVVRHVGATVVLADVIPGTFEIDPARVAAALTPRTKAIVPVDIAGWPCDYTALGAVAESARAAFVPAGERQAALGRPLVMADAAHSLGSSFDGKRLPAGVDAWVTSFHAVKNLTTAEGGCVAFPAGGAIDAAAARAALRVMALHGQDRDALAKSKGGGWEYDIQFSGWKCNLTDIQAALGRAQLARYDAQLAGRERLAAVYADAFAGHPRLLAPPFADPRRAWCRHYWPLRVDGYGEAERNGLLTRLADAGIAANVHFKPYPMFTAFRGQFPDDAWREAYLSYANEVSLPIYPALTDEEAVYVAETVLELV